MGTIPRTGVVVHAWNPEVNQPGNAQFSFVKVIALQVHLC